MQKKLEHWWTYYKGVVIFAVVLAAAVLYVADTMGKKKRHRFSWEKWSTMCRTMR